MLSVVLNLCAKVFLNRNSFSFLASGDMQKSIAKLYRIGRSTIHDIIHETCQKIYTVMQPLYLPTLSTKQWEQIAAGYEEKWQFPNCLGAIDGKHFSIVAPAHSGTQYYNYKVNNLNQ